MIDYDYIISHLPEITTILAAFVIFFWQTRKKTLAYSVLTNSGLVSSSKHTKDTIQIVHKGNAVPNVRLVVVRIQNSGNLPIKPDDYIEPLSLRLPNSKILSSAIRDANSLGVTIEKERSDRSEIVLSKTLLNPKDFFDVKILLSGGAADLSVIGRIVGVTRIQNLTGRNVNYYILMSLIVVNVLALAARFLGWLDRGIVIILQILTLLFGVWMSLDTRTKPEDLEN